MPGVSNTRRQPHRVVLETFRLRDGAGRDTCGLAGHDTFRGCSFQTAYAVRLAFDVLEGKAELLQVEGDSDVVDAALEAADQTVLRSIQAKTKLEPYVWRPGAIASVVKSWLAGEPSAEESLDFVTDGHLGEGVAEKLVPALVHLREGIASEEELAYLAALDIDTENEALTRVALHSGLPQARDLLEQETLRLMELREHENALTAEEARELVKSLFGEMILDSGDQDREQRRLTRAEIAERVGVSLEAIDTASTWSQDLEQRYRATLLSEAPDPTLTMLELLGEEGALAPAQITPTTEGGFSMAMPATQLIDQGGWAQLSGPAGAGKSTTLGQLALEAAGKDPLPVKLFVASYATGSLSQLLRRSIEQRVETPIATGSVELLLSRETTLVLIDGAGELSPEQRSSLIADVEAIRARHPDGARMIFAARHAPALTKLGLSEFSVQGLDRDGRREIAEATDAQKGVAECEQIEAELGSILEIPLLFRLALGLRLKGIEAHSRAELFAQFIERLQNRPEGGKLSAQELSVLEKCCFDLRFAGLYSAEEWWWLETIAAERERQIERGLISGEAASAAELLEGLVGVGIVRRLGQGTDLALLHDLFADWFCAGAIRKQIATLPTPVPQKLEEAVLFLAELDALSPAQLVELASSPIAAARAADAIVAERADVAMVGEIWERLMPSLGAELRATYEALELRLSADGCAADLIRPGEDDERLAVMLSVVGRAPVTSFSLAVDLWLGAVRVALASVDPSYPLVASDDQVELASQLADASGSRIELTAALIAELVPSLKRRLRDEIGPLGIRGWLTPPRELASLIEGQGDSSEHELIYSHVSEGPTVTPIADPAETPDADALSGRMIAEAYLRETPAEAARQSLKNALSRLIPRFE